MSTFPDQLYQFGGAPVNGFLGQGKSIFVLPAGSGATDVGSDGNSGFKITEPVATLAQAKSLATANQNDVVYMLAHSNTANNTTDYQSTSFDWNKDGVHLIGLNAGSFIGQRSRIAQLSTVKTIEDLFTVSADNCLVANIEVFQGVATSTATSPRAVVVSGERNKFYNCQLSGNGDTGGSMDTAGARSLAVTGAENHFEHSYIGLDTVIRGTQTSETSVANARNSFEKCVINSYTSLSTFKAITTTSATAGRDIYLIDTMLCASGNVSSAVAPTGAISHAVAGQVKIYGGGVFGYADVTTADNSTVLLLSHSGLAANVVDQGVAKATDVA